MATLTTKFSLGQEVWKIQPTTETIKLPCRLCLGRGSLLATGAGEENRWVNCPDCGVNATVTLGSWPEWRVDAQLTIAMIPLRVMRSGQLSGYPTNEEGYMCWSTGVGSGTMHAVEDLFATREEAQEEAELRTERARAGEEPGGRKDRWARWWPTAEQVRVAAGFLDHRDIYEHDAGHVALAQKILEVAAKREQ